MATNAQLIYHLPLKLTWKETPHSRTSPSGSRKDQPPCSKKPSGSSTMVFIILVQLRDCTPSVYFRSQELRKITLWSKKINPPYSAFGFGFLIFLVLAMPKEQKEQSLNHWTTRETPPLYFFRTSSVMLIISISEEQIPFSYVRAGTLCTISPEHTPKQLISGLPEH